MKHYRGPTKLARHQLYLEVPKHRWLVSEAQRRGVTLATVVREAIDAYMQKDTKETPNA